MTRLRKFRKDEDGAKLVFFEICMTAIVGVVAVTFYLGRLASTQTELQAYTPVFTAAFVNLKFDYMSPMGALVALVASEPTIATTSPNRITLPAMSTSVPA